MKYIDTWDLDAIFPGGTKSPELQTKLHNLKEEIQEYEKIIQRVECDMITNLSIR